jgi:hypothetical protein
MMVATQVFTAEEKTQAMAAVTAALSAPEADVRNVEIASKLQMRVTLAEVEADPLFDANCGVELSAGLGVPVDCQGVAAVTLRRRLEGAEDYQRRRMEGAEDYQRRRLEGAEDYQRRRLEEGVEVAFTITVPAAVMNYTASLVCRMHLPYAPLSRGLYIAWCGILVCHTKKGKRFRVNCFMSQYSYEDTI